MTSVDIAAQVEQTVQYLRQLDKASNLAEWNAAVKGTQENLEIAAEHRAELMRFWADPAAYEQYREWHQANAGAEDMLLARQIHLLYLGFARGQQDEELIDEMNQLLTTLTDTYVNFRGQVNGEPLSNNAIEQILDEETDNELRQEAWEASKQIGPLVADPLRQLARLRNRGAQKIGYSNFHRMSLDLEEMDPDWLYAMLDDLAIQTEAPFRQAKAELDAALSERFQVPVEALRPWHYSDMFFQRAPKVGSVNLDPLYEGQDLEALGVLTYDGLGMDVRDVLARSDLYEREMKNQHAFCTHIDREGDVRTLCNLQQNNRWMDTLLHELGHAVYDKYIPMTLPWLLRTPAHTLTTEAMALLMGGLTLDRDWLVEVRGLNAADVEPLITQTEAYQRLGRLIFTRWVMVMVNFERGLYQDPEQDLDTLWWDLVEKYQLLTRPEGRQMPDWATKYHVAAAPAYYQNYLLGEMTAIQWRRYLDESAGGLVNCSDAGDFFRDRVFALGGTLPWNEAMEVATGEPLNIQYFVEKCS